MQFQVRLCGEHREYHHLLNPYKYSLNYHMVIGVRPVYSMVPLALQEGHLYLRCWVHFISWIWTTG